MSDPQGKWMDVTPELAKKWLDRNEDNYRNLHQATVNRYADMMTRDEWLKAGDPVRFDVEGTLADGQHRLNAVIIADTTVPLFVMHGVDRTVVDVMDTGRKRMPSDVLRRHGYNDSVQLSAVAKFIWHWETNGPDRFTSFRTSQPSNVQRLEVIDRYMPELYEALTAGRRLTALGVTVTDATFVKHVLDHIDRDEADTFWAYLVSGAGMSEKDPVHRLRNALIKNMSAKRKMDRLTVIAIIFKTWNATRDGKRPMTLGWRSEGPKSEPFPRPH